MPLDSGRDHQSINLVDIGEVDSRLPSPINLDIRDTREITLPSIKWNNADEVPRLMKISNSGHSVIITAKWFGPYRPYITGSKLPGTYIFSQAHFHWGRDDNEGSEHTIEGNGQPLELHVMYFKTDYGTPEKAMKELDGIVVLAYLYNVRKQGNAGLEPIVNVLPKVIQPFTSSAIDLTPISKIAPVFTEDFYLYWGSVCANTTYRILWFIHREAQNVSKEQLAIFRKLMDANKQPLLSNFRETKSLNGRRVFYVNPRNMTTITLIGAPPDPPEPSIKDQLESEANNKKGKKMSKAAKGGKDIGERRKSAKRKSSVRRKSKKSISKVQKSQQPKGKKSSNNDINVLVSSVSYSFTGSKSLSSPISTDSILTEKEDDEKTTCSFDMKQFEVRCETLERERSTKQLPMANVADLIGGTTVLSKCEEILNKLQACSVKKKETCLPILNELESFIKRSLETSDTKHSHEDLSKFGLNNEIDLSRKRDWALSVTCTSESFDPVNKLKQYVPTKVEGSHTVPPEPQVFPTCPQSVIRRSVPVEWSTFSLVMLPELQYAEVFVVPRAEQRRLHHVVIGKSDRDFCQPQSINNAQQYGGDNYEAHNRLQNDRQFVPQQMNNHHDSLLYESKLRSTTPPYVREGCNQDGCGKTICNNIQNTQYSSGNSSTNHQYAIDLDYNCPIPMTVNQSYQPRLNSTNITSDASHPQYSMDTDFRTPFNLTNSSYIPRPSVEDINNSDTPSITSQLAENSPEKIGKNDLKRSEFTAVSHEVDTGVEPHNQRTMRLPELITNNAMVSSLWQQMTGAGMHYVSEEAIGIVQSQASIDIDYIDHSDTLSPNISRVKLQSSFMEIEPSMRSSSTKFRGQRVEKLLRRKSSFRQFPNTGSPSIRGGPLRRQTIVTTMFYDDMSTSHPFNKTSLKRSAQLDKRLHSRVDENSSDFRGPPKKTAMKPKPAWKY